MTAPEWSRVRELFELAVDETPASRAVLLARECAGDEALRREVESLLAEHDDPDGALGGTHIAPIEPLIEALGDRGGERLALAEGMTLDGKYRVEALVGRGGMGEVYRARDLRLGRDVAVKVLPPALSRDPERLRRFTHEARAAGLLNHPNVVAVYDTGTHEGAPYVVSELLEGESLRARLSRGPMPIRKALELASQVARGLAAAHAKGIVHRDLKPDNVFVTRDERAKVLDFGIAKLTHPAGDGEPSALETEPGVIMGTTGYMSPEQVRGEPVDHRSDVFAFGAVLYEMLAGRPAFRGASAVETMHAILHDDPPPLEERSGAVPRGAELVVRRCLEKVPDARFQSTEDLAFEVGTLADSTSHVSTRRSSGPRRAWRARARRLVPALAALAILAGPIVGFIAGSRLATAPTPSYQRLTFRRGGVYNARFAPDGQTIVYGAAWAGAPITVFSTRLGSSESRPLGFGDARLAAVSSSGELAVILGRRFGETTSPSGMLARVPLAGGAPREVLADVTEADWSPDGLELAVVHRVGGRDRLEYPIGRVLYEGATEGTIGLLRVSPKGDRVAFIAWARGAELRGTIAVVDLEGKATILTREWPVALGIAWAPGGDEVWFTAGERGFDLGIHAVTLSGEQRPVARVPGAMFLRDIATDGRVLVERMNVGVEAACMVPGHTRETDLSWLDWSELAGLSDDGAAALLKEKGEGGGPGTAVYLRKTDGSPAVRLGDGYALALSPDGQWALVLRAGPAADLVLLPAGPGQPITLERGPIDTVESATWFPDGRRVLLQGNEAGSAVRCYVASVDGGAPAPVTPRGVTGDVVSPDGRFVLAFDPARSAWFRYPVDGGEATSVLGLLAGEETIRWSADGRSVFVFRRAELPARVVRVDLETGHRETWREITPPDPAGVDGLAMFRMTPDARGYAYSYIRVISDLYLVEGLR